MTKMEENEIQDWEEESEKAVKRFAKNIISFILTIIAIVVVLFGTCLVNLAIIDHREYLTVPLLIAWPLVPLVLFGWIAYKTKNAGVFWAIIFLIAAGLFIVAM